MDNISKIIKTIDPHREITINERRSRYIRTAIDFLEREKGKDAVEQLLHNLGIKMNSSIYEHIMDDDNWNSYLLEVAILEEWIKFFDYEVDYYRQLGMATASGDFDKKSGLIEVKFKLAPIRVLVEKVAETSNLFSLVSYSYSRVFYNRNTEQYNAILV